MFDIHTTHDFYQFGSIISVASHKNGIDIESQVHDVIQGRQLKKEETLSAEEIRYDGPTAKGTKKETNQVQVFLQKEGKNNNIVCNSRKV